MSTTFKIFPDLLEVSGSFKGILLDAYGVFWNGGSLGVIPGSKETMSSLVSSGKIVGILSNSTALAEKEKNKLQAHGLIQGKHFHFLLTSGEVAKYIFCEEKLPFKTLNKKFWLFGNAHPKFSSHQPIFQESSYRETQDLSEADFIYISIPHINGEDQIDSVIFEQDIKKLVNTGLPMVCANPDRFAHEGNPPRAVVRQGSIAAIYEKLGGTVFYIGKPSSSGYIAAMQYFSQYEISNAREVLMVGDTPETDIRGARNFGMAAALITQTGIMADRISQKGLEASIHLIPQADFPDFLIQRLTSIS